MFRTSRSTGKSKHTFWVGQSWNLVTTPSLDRIGQSGNAIAWVGVCVILS